MTPRVRSLLAFVATCGWITVTAVGGEVPLFLIAVLSVAALVAGAIGVVDHRPSVATLSVSFAAGAHLAGRVGRTPAPMITVITAVALLLSWRLLVLCATGADRFRPTSDAMRHHRRDLLGLLVAGTATSAMAMAATDGGRGRGTAVYVAAAVSAVAAILLPATFRSGREREGALRRRPPGWTSSVRPNLIDRDS
jgi:hypothetical protein